MPAGRPRAPRSSSGRSTSTTNSSWWPRSRERPRCTTPTGSVSPTAGSITTWRVANSRTLFQAAKRAGVQRIVHVSITHPGIDSPFPYFRGKALVERALAEVGLSYAIVRPAILFGGDGVLLNNIAWLLRHLPVFAIGGRGDYRIRGIHVDDLAQLCVAKGAERVDSVTDAVGPERPTFTELVRSIREVVGSRSRLLHVPGSAIPVLRASSGWALHDQLLTREEYRAMAAGLADSDAPTTGPTALSEWLRSQRILPRDCATPTSSTVTSRRSATCPPQVDGPDPRALIA